jgi:hypothetical protein
MFNSDLVGNLQPFPKAVHDFLASFQFIASGKSYSATNKLPILIGSPIISLAFCAKERQVISNNGKNKNFFIARINFNLNIGYNYHKGDFLNKKHKRKVDELPVKNILNIGP